MPPSPKPVAESVELVHCCSFDGLCIWLRFVRFSPGASTHMVGVILCHIFAGGLHHTLHVCEAAGEVIAELRHNAAIKDPVEDETQYASSERHAHSMVISCLAAHVSTAFQSYGLHYQFETRHAGLAGQGHMALPAVCLTHS